MSSWAAVVNPRATQASLEDNSSVEDSTHGERRTTTNINNDVVRTEKDARTNRGTPLSDGRRVQGSRRSTPRKDPGGRGRKGSRICTGSSGKKSVAGNMLSPERDTGQVDKARSVFGAPPAHAWHTAVETKERIFGGTHDDGDVVSERKGDVDAIIRTRVDVSGDGMTLRVCEETPVGDASLRLLSENSYEKVIEYQDGSRYVVIPKGIRNPGNVCFANSVIQALLGTEPFCQLMYHIGHARFESIDRCPVLQTLSDIAKDMDFFNGETLHAPVYTGSSSTIHVGLVVALIRESFKIRYKGEGKNRQVEQEDAHEFLHCLLDALHQEFVFMLGSDGGQDHGRQNSFEDGDEWLTQSGKKAVKQHIVTAEVMEKRTTIITELFEGMQSTCISSRGNPPSVTIHPFLVVEIPLYDPSIETLEGAIDSLTATETISGYRPRGHDHPCDASKSEKFNSLPKILVFHLMRFQFTGSTEKLRKRIQYGGILNIKPSWLMPSSKDRQARYELVSTISHHGQSIAKGHFTANVKHQGKWLHCNDETVRGTKDDHVFRDEPYMLFYVKCE